VITGLQCIWRHKTPQWFEDLKHRSGIRTLAQNAMTTMPRRRHNRASEATLWNDNTLNWNSRSIGNVHHIHIRSWLQWKVRFIILDGKRVGLKTWVKNGRKVPHPRGKLFTMARNCLHFMSWIRIGSFQNFLPGRESLYLGTKLWLFRRVTGTYMLLPIHIWTALGVLPSSDYPCKFV
jgi:hypothetical protein